ncbi:MAG: pilus assembly protein PilM [Desulfobacteraceae bacterium]|nr:pilus assembly protein PilM [Desulfobacteraceae bacterium]
MSRQILAIDIRNDSAAAVLLSTGLKNSLIEDCMFISLHNDKTDAKSIDQIISDVTEKIPAGGASVLVALPAHQALYRFVSLPFDDDKKISQALPFELEPLLPIAVEKLKIDYYKQVLEDKTDLLTVAIDKEILENYQDGLEQNGLQAQLIVPGAFPLVLTFLAHTPHLPDHALILDMDDDRATLFVLKEGRLIAVRILAGGIRSESTAESMALRIRQTIMAVTDTRSMEFKPAGIFLCGPGLRRRNNVNTLVSVLEIPAQPIDLRTYLPRVESSAQVQSWNPPAMDNALALALLETEAEPCPSFLRTSSLLKNYWNLYKPFVRIPVVLLALLISLGLCGIILDNYLLQKKIDSIDAQMVEIFKSTFPGKRLITGNAIDQMKSEIKSIKSGSIDPTQSIPAVSCVDILLEISKLIPKDKKVELLQMSVGGDNLTISGTTPEYQTVDDMKVQLEKADYFKKVTIASANTSKSGNAVRFKLKIDI